MWIDGGTHAREWITPAVVTWLIKEVVEFDHKHPHFTGILDWYFLPVLNPDGYEFSRTKNRNWRKTRSCHVTQTCAENCIGTDPNRNWGYKWKNRDHPCDFETYGGPAPFSEVENRNVRDFILGHKNEIKFFNSLHSNGQMVILPWCYIDSKPEGYHKMKEMAETVRTSYTKSYCLQLPREDIRVYAYMFFLAGRISFKLCIWV